MDDVLVFSLRHLARCVPGGRDAAVAAMMLLGCTCKAYNARVKRAEKPGDLVSAVHWNTGGLFDPPSEMYMVERYAGYGARAWRFVRTCVEAGMRPYEVAKLCLWMMDADSSATGRDRFAVASYLIKEATWRGLSTQVEMKIALYRRMRAGGPLPAPEQLVGDPAAVDWDALRQHAGQVRRTRWLPNDDARLHEWHSRCMDSLRASLDKLLRYQRVRPCAFSKDAAARASIERHKRAMDVLQYGK